MLCVIVKMMLGGVTAAYPTVMSKMLDPTELDTAMSPSPFLATITLVMRSGMEVPAASMVNPMISSVIPIVSPTCKTTQQCPQFNNSKYYAWGPNSKDAIIITDY